jgi:solute carrier family 26 (sodium-independent sulfate anion transporter), member 11
MPPKVNNVLSKLPVIGQYHKDKAAREAQNSYFATLDTNSGYIEPTPTVLEFVKRAKPTKQGVLQYVLDTFPCSKWICNYNLSWLIGDIVAGITVGAVVIPQGMAYAKLAQLPVQYGLYTSFIGGLCYWLFGTSKDISIGPVAVASIVTAQIVADLAAEHPKDHLEAPVLAGIVAMMSGAVIAILGVLRLGWLVDLIALPAVSSFITGSALTITFGQIPPLLGMRGINSRDPAIKIGINILKHLDRIRIDAAIGITALVLLYVIKWTCSLVAKRRPEIAKTIFFVSTLRTVVTIIIYTIISFVLNHNRKKDPVIRVLGFIPRGFQATRIPQIDSELMKSMINQIPAAAIVLIIEHISIGKEFGRINNYTINPNSEFLAIGVVNILGPMVGAYAATGSFSRTAINSKAGSRTPMSGVITALVVVIALYTMTGAFFFVPTSALAAVIIHAIGDCTNATLNE